MSLRTSVKTFTEPMNKRFKIAYYFLIALFTVVFSYQIYLLVYTLLDKPHYEVGFLVIDDE